MGVMDSDSELRKAPFFLIWSQFSKKPAMERVSGATPVDAAAKLAALRASTHHGRSGAGAGAAFRDPRTVPTSLHKNVTIAETCAFYGLQDAVSTCRVPRSCQDCLEMPGCVVSSIGQCRSIPDLHVDAENNYDYHKQLAQYPLGTGYNVPLTSSTPSSYFYADNATYCAASDAVCAACRASFREASLLPKAKYQVGSQFCVGAGGCVCIAMCEVPELRDRYIYDQDCGQSTPKGLPSKPAELQAFTTTHRDPRAPLVNVHRRESRQRTCAYHEEQDVQGCHQPRTCQECLQEDECVVSRFMCTAMDEYQPWMDFRLAKLDAKNSSETPYAQFPSSNTTYCPASDAVCAACRQGFQASWKKASQWDVIASISNFCVGENGCVCIEACESDQWSTAVRDTECSAISKNVSSSAVAPLVIAVAAWFLLIIYKRCTRRFVPPARQAVQQVWRHMVDEVPVIGRLDLFGWRAYHERLLAKEDELLRGEEPGSPVLAPVSFDFEASAPDFDEDESSAPTAHNPTALASAPTYMQEVDGTRDYLDHDLTAPSAPDFDEEDGGCLMLVAVNESRVSVTRRSRRIRDDA